MSDIDENFLLHQRTNEQTCSLQLSDSVYYNGHAVAGIPFTEPLLEKANNVYFVKICTDMIIKSWMARDSVWGW